MRHLAARFVPKIAENIISLSNQCQFNITPLHVVDPNLDFREEFANVEKLKENLEKRQMFDSISNLPKIRDDYFRWWKTYSNLVNCGVDKKDPNQRDKYIEVRSELLKHSEGLLGALALPNYLDVEPEINDRYVLNNYIAKDLDEIVESVRCQQTPNNSTIQLNKLRSSLLNFLIKKLKPAPIHFSGPYLVRPALVECCNICLNEVPLITDCVDPPLCLVGTNIPSFLSILVNGCLTSSNNWPLSLIAAGPVYYKTTKNLAKFFQTEQISILTIGRDKEECVSRQAEIFTILKNFLKKILEEEELEVSVKQPENLQLWERSSLSIDRGFDESGDDKISQIASFSNIGDYISRRAHVVFDTGNKNKNLEIDKNPNYAQMAFTTINLDNLIKCF
uniref:Uncharacterized protein n=1 Tax=Meloidogyne enterolobii TaxID=390850 RepID=A0A6V7UHK8_MELEN|nr:unnamed protein product [Meloidogyne enterolobii]